jgi:hypothetical protein
MRKNLSGIIRILEQIWHPGVLSLRGAENNDNEPTDLAVSAGDGFRFASHPV